MHASTISPRHRTIGRVLSGLAILLLVADGIFKLIAPAPVTETFVRMGLPVDLTAGIGLLELFCTAVYAVPRTALHGAILLTGFLGGAVLSHLRLHDPWFSHTLFPCYVGMMVWGGLLLRDPRIRSLALGSAPCAEPQR